MKILLWFIFYVFFKVWEETGYDIRPIAHPDQFIENTIHDHQVNIVICQMYKVFDKYLFFEVIYMLTTICIAICYAMLCYAMLCYAMLCYAMLCYAMLCYAMLYCTV